MRILDPQLLTEPLRSRVLEALEKQGRPGSHATPAPKPGKYRNQPVVVDGERFASKLEHACHVEQLARWKRGEILFTLRQISFPLPGGVVYRCDNFNPLPRGGVEVIDAKGTLTKEFVIKAKQMLAVYGIEVLLWNRRGMKGFSARTSSRKKTPPSSSSTPGATVAGTVSVPSAGG